LWDVEKGEQLRTFKSPDSPSAGHGVAFSPDGRRFVSGGDAVVSLWDFETGMELKQFVGHTGNVWCVAFSSDGNRVLSGSQDGTLRIWSVDRN
jgi:WD40 repeat protein